MYKLLLILMLNCYVIGFGIGSDCTLTDSLNRLELENQKKEIQTQFFLAIKDGNLDAVKFFLERGADINGDDSYDSKIHETQGTKATALHFCALFNQIEIAKYLLSLKANINADSYYHDTPLSFACQFNRIELVKILLDHNPKLDVKGISEYTALHFAAEYGHSEIVSLLLKSKANIDIADCIGHLPLHRAIEQFDAGQSNIECAKMLVNGPDENALWKAAYKPQFVEVVKLLIDAGTDINCKEPGSESEKGVISRAALGKSYDTVAFLLCANANLNFNNSLYTSVVKRVLKEGFHWYNENDEVLDSLTGLMWCSIFGNCDLINKYYANNDLSEQALDGQTALMLAHKYKRDDVVKLLMSRIKFYCLNIKNETALPLPLAKLIGQYLFG